MNTIQRWSTVSFHLYSLLSACTVDNVPQCHHSSGGIYIYMSTHTQSCLSHVEIKYLITGLNKPISQMWTVTMQYSSLPYTCRLNVYAYRIHLPAFSRNLSQNI